MKIVTKIISMIKHIRECFSFLLFKKSHIRIYELDYDIKDPVLKTAIRNRKRRIVKFIE